MSFAFIMTVDPSDDTGQLKGHSTVMGNVNEIGFDSLHGQLVPVADGASDLAAFGRRRLER